MKVFCWPRPPTGILIGSVASSTKPSTLPVLARSDTPSTGKTSQQLRLQKNGANCAASCPATLSLAPYAEGQRGVDQRHAVSLKIKKQGAGLHPEEGTQENDGDGSGVDVFKPVWSCVSCRSSSHLFRDSPWRRTRIVSVY